MIRVRLPATSANLGPGFDCMGLALGLYSTVDIELTEGESMVLQGSSKDTGSALNRNLVYRAACTVFDYAGLPVPNMAIRLTSNIPSTRGLGSSAACIIGGLVGANALCGRLGPRDILTLACRMEGHPDNVAPCLLGGLVSAYYDGYKVTYSRLSLGNDICLAVTYPSSVLPTKKARMTLPKSVSHSDAAYNAAHTALLAMAFAKHKYELLDEAMGDRLHQPYRRRMIEGMDEALDFFKSLGAYGCYLSGSGPAIAAVVPKGKKHLLEEAGRLWADKKAFHFGVYDFDNVGSFVKKLDDISLVARKD